MEKIADTRMYVEFDTDIGVWDVYEREGRYMTPKGFVYTEDDGSWSSARHTYSGIPTTHGEGFATRDDAATSLRGAEPFRDEE